MTDFVPSDSELLPACADVLTERLVPIHYSDLTEMAIRKIGYQISRINMFRTIEDVRERLPRKRDLGVFYTSAPACLMAKKSWFPSMQLPLLNPDFVVIPGSATCGYLGAFESLMRDKHMEDHWHGNVMSKNRNRARGLVIEKHVSEWFRLKWPGMYEMPDNNGIWEKSCSHDFKLIVGGKKYLVDVAGLGRNGYQSNKKSTDIHLLCRIDGDNVVWEGVSSGKRLSEICMPEEAKSPISMVVWLNCHASGIDYDSIVRHNSKSLVAIT